MTQQAHCKSCEVVGRYLPWALIVSGGVFSVLPDSLVLGKTAAYLVAFGLLGLLGAIILNRLNRDNFRRIL
jgi:hypothetical protein